MILQICRIIVKLLLTLRYRVRISGLESCLRRGKQGIIFMPNHPALIDPIILCSILMGKFHLRALVSERQVRTTLLKYFHRPLHILQMPDIGAAGRSGHDMVLKQLQTCVEALKAGDNLLFYPAGRIYRSKFESLRGNGGAARILEEYPGARVVLVRSRGLWGSDFSRAKGYQSPFGQTLMSHLKHLLLNAVFFGPRRQVHIELVEKPADFPTIPDRDTLNRYLEDFYNQGAEGNTYMPYTWCEKGGARILPEPEAFSAPEDTANVPVELRDQVYDKLREMSGKKILRDGDFLGNDLGLEGSAINELTLWLQTEYEQPPGSISSLSTVAGLLLAAMGESSASLPLQEVPMHWFLPERQDTVKLASGENICRQFLENVSQQSTRVLLAEQELGVLTQRQLLVQALTLRQSLQAIPDKQLGLLMPPGAQRLAWYLACLLDAKLPLLLDTRIDLADIRQNLQKAKVEHILSTRQFRQNLKGASGQLAEFEDKLIYAEDLQAKSGGLAKFSARLRAVFCLRSVARWQPHEYAAMLPNCDNPAAEFQALTHAELLDELRLALQKLQLRQDDSLLCTLPGSSKAGLLLGLLMPLCSGLRQVYHAETRETELLLRLTAAYRISVLAGDRQTLANMLRRARVAQLTSLRLLLCHNESEDPELLELARQKCPEAKIIPCA
ncbi:MAG: acyl-[ACP]--phospholipid O-acyltransferase [Lentisphaeria bacterium]